MLLWIAGMKLALDHASSFMLNSQRERHPKHQSDLIFTRRLLRAHMAVGWIPALLLFLHNQAFLSSAAMIWWLASLVMVPPIKSGRDFARAGLGYFCLAGVAGSLYLLTQSPGALPPSKPAFLAHDWLPLWAGMMAAFYLILGLMLFYNKRVKKAVIRGFYRW